MTTQARQMWRTPPHLPKAVTGIAGFDEITFGGLPRGRTTLLCGAAGSGKTLFAVEFLVRGAITFNEPGVFMAFEESREELTQNVASLGFDLNAMVAARKLAIDHVQIEREEIEETGEYDLEALFVRLNYAIDTVGAKRVVLDTLEALFGALPNQMILRAELRRLFRWLKAKGVTAVVTAERGEGALTRHGLEEYISDCVILLDNRVTEQNAVRRMRVVKYRGSGHGTNEYPFIIDTNGFSVLPISSLKLNHTVETRRVSSGIPALDAMLGGKGYYRGSSVLVTGNAGAGKTTMAVHFAIASCKRGERCLFVAHEESPAQIIRDMKPIGFDLQRCVRENLLHMVGIRPTESGLEAHLAFLQRLITDIKPVVVVIDPVDNFLMMGSAFEVKGLLLRLIDVLKARKVTALFTSLSESGSAAEPASAGISSLIDVWVSLRELELNGERKKALYVLKARGIAKSDKVRRFDITRRGIEIRPLETAEASSTT